MPAVLIVDDDADLLVALSDAVDNEGWTVLAASSGAAALDLAQSNRIDVVLADLSLADGAGRALEKAFRALGPAGTPPLVFMTGSSLNGRQVDGWTVLTKPFDVRELMAVLEAAVRRRGSLPKRPRAQTIQLGSTADGRGTESES
jgi:DNA-binding response OmpR family regulator